MDNKYKQTIIIGIIGGLVLGAILFGAVILTTYISGLGWIVYSFQILTTIVSAAVGILAIRYNRDLNTTIKDVIITSCIAGTVSGAVATTIDKIVLEVIIFIKFGIFRKVSFPEGVYHNTSLVGDIMMDVFVIIFFTICTAFTAAAAGIIYARFFQAKSYNN